MFYGIVKLTFGIALAIKIGQINSVLVNFKTIYLIAS